MNRLIVFDLDGTLAESKVPITEEIAALMRRLLARYQVGVISGASFDRMNEQLIDHLHANPGQLARLHVLPTNGTHYYRYDLDAHDWQAIYTEDIPADEKVMIASAIERTAKRLGYWENKTWGPIIEDRGSQVTFSALGQSAPLEAKRIWDPDGSKKRALRDDLAPLLPDYEVHSAGLTSIDVTVKGLDKASAITKLKDILGVPSSAVLYVGDALAPGGNDAVVREAGFETIAVSGPSDTAKEIKRLLQA